MDDQRSDPEFELSGGALCLDFANTVGNRPRSSEEKLAAYDDVLRWSRQAATLPAAELARLECLADDHPDAARKVFRRAIALRETIYRIFARLARAEAPGDDDLRSLNATLPTALRQLEIRARHRRFEWAWSGPQEALDRPLWPVIRSAADLLTSEEVNRIRECASGTCSWLFVDRSRNRRRRWCDMATCGNRAKARRHYERRKRERPPEPPRADPSRT